MRRLARRSAVLAVLALLATTATGTAAAGTQTPGTPGVNTAPSYNGLALTPPMGFNSWAGFECNHHMNEALFTRTADDIVRLGLDKLGYDYVNLDDCWMQRKRDANGDLQVDAGRFPHGMKWLADYIHGKGLKFGTYESAGYKTCTGSAGSYGHFQQDANLYASWGVDYLKLDYCHRPDDEFPDKTKGEVAEMVYTEASDALLATGRPIVFSESAPAYVCCSSDDFKYELTWLYKHGNLWRFGNDIENNWDSVVRNYSQANTPGLAQWAGPGHWNDADMLEIGNGGLSLTEERSQFTLWSELASPLLLSTTLSTLSPEQLAVISNKDVIAVDQDPMGAQGTIVQSGDGYDVLAKPLANGDVAVVLFNKGETATTLSTTATQVGLGKPNGAYTLTDLWSKKTTETAGQIAAYVPAHGTVMYRVSTAHGWDSHPPATTLALSIPPAYAGGPAAVEPGSTTTATTTVTNAGRMPITDLAVTVDAPAGWTVRPVSATTDNEAGTGTSVTTTWSVEAPATVSGGIYPLTATAHYLWDDGTQSDSTAASGDVLVPPTNGTVYVSDLDWTRHTNDWGPVERDTSNGETAAGDGGPITINGQVYDKGIGVDAPSEVDVYAGGHCTSLSTDVGVDDEVGPKGTVAFQVWADGTKVADTGRLTGNDDAVHLTADVSGAHFVRLVVTDWIGGKGYDHSYDHADWAGTTLTCD